MAKKYSDKIKITNMGSMIGLAVLIIGLYMIIQINYLSYYRTFGIPFGRTDVDIYMNHINDHSYDKSPDPIITYIPRMISNYISPGLFITFLIPIFLCILLPISVYMLAFSMTNDGTISLYSTVLYVFGTVSFVAFGISALWSQLLSTVFFIWFFILYEGYEKTGNKKLIWVSIAMCLLAILSHPKSVGLFVLYIMVKLYYEKDFINLILMILCAFAVLFVFGNELFSSYPYSFTVGEVFQLFMSPILWVLSFFGICGILRSKAKVLTLSCVLSLLVLVVSYFSILWRPLLSVLPFFVIFATLTLFWVFSKIKPELSIIIGVLFVVLMMIFFYQSIQSGIYEMYKDMILSDSSGIRTSIDAETFKSIYGIVNVPVYEVNGFVSDLTGNVVETVA